MYNSCYRDGIVKTNVGKKGVLLARRDNSKFVRDTYEKVISMIFEKTDKEEVIYYIIEQFNKLCSNSFSYSDFVVTKSLGSVGNLEVVPFINEKGQKKGKIGDYTVNLLPVNKEEREKKLKDKNATTDKEFYHKSLPAQIQLAEKMKRRGLRVDAGTRLEYVITVGPGHTANQYEKIENIEYFLQHSDVLKIDCLYYLKLITNPLDQVMSTAFKMENFALTQYKLRLEKVKVLKQLTDYFKPKLVFED